MLSSCHAEGWNSIAAGIRFSELRLSVCQDVVWCPSLTVYIRSGGGGRPNSTRKLETLDGSLDDGMGRGREACKSI